MSRAKEIFRALGIESLFMLLEIVIACIATFVQTLLKQYIDDYSGFIWSGSNYQYNYFMYFLGIVFWVGASILLYKKFEKHIMKFSSMGLAKIILILVLLIWGVVMCYSEFFVIFVMVLGLSNNLGPDALFILTLIGWPLITVIFLAVNITIRKKTIEVNGM